jgi:CheY-like chemotaxis protein
MHNIHLIHWKAAEAQKHIAALREAGYRVTFEEFSPTIIRKMRQNPPDAVVIDLTRLPAQGRDVAMTLRQYEPLRTTPIVFVDGEPSKVAKVKKQLPDAVFTSWSRIRSGLKKAILHPPAEPVVPASSLAGYADTPLPKKLGIKPDSVIALVKAPEGFDRRLSELPPGVSLMRSTLGRRDLTIWFTRTTKELRSRIEQMAKVAGDNLWIAWPKKSSALASDLSQAEVRKVGLAAGLVDYKVCAIDETWSGLKFTRRKSKKTDTA